MPLNHDAHCAEQDNRLAKVETAQGIQGEKIRTIEGDLDSAIDRWQKAVDDNNELKRQLAAFERDVKHTLEVAEMTRNILFAGIAVVLVTILGAATAFAMSGGMRVAS